MKQQTTWLALIIWIAGSWRAGVNSWTTGGPYGGEIMSLVVDYQTPNVIYVGTMGGGIYKSQNWGQSWTVVNNGLGDMEVEAWSWIPRTTISCTPDRSWVCPSPRTGGTLVFGQQRPPYQQLLGIGHFGDESPDPVRGCYNNNGGIFKSTNGGESWTRVIRA